MLLSDFYPHPNDLIRNELRVLERLMDDPYIAAEHSQFARDARIYHNRYRRLRDGFEFFSYFDVFHTEMPRRGKASGRRQLPNLRLIVASTIERKSASTYGNVSYCLIVCRLRSGHPAILRKFHFDITAGAGGRNARRQQHPMCHLQYCGGMIPQMADMGLRPAQLQQMHMKLSEPRLFFWPMSLALLIDMTLHEFPDTRSRAFRATPEWRGVIRENENLLLLPFYQKCVEVIERKVEAADRRTDTAPRNRTLADEFYIG
jgi:hypothetical protein